MMVAARRLAVAGVLALVAGLFALSAVPEDAARSALRSVASAALSAVRPGAMLAARAPAMLHVADVQALVKRFGDAGFDLDRVRDGNATVPRLYLARLPKDIGDLDVPEARKQAFIQALLPLILKANEEAAVDRAKLMVLERRIAAGHPLGAAEQAWLAALAAAYNGRADNIPDLLRRVDAVPPSLALGQAAEETGWGTSRVALVHNALFGQQTWVASPEQAGAPEPQIKAFQGLMASVAAYIHNLNSHSAYRSFRLMRAQLRRAGQPLDGYVLVTKLGRYSERGAAYIAAVRRIIRSNGLTAFDRARLGDGGAPPRS